MVGAIAASVAVPFLLMIVCLAASLRLARRRDAQRRERMPDTFSYQWGYFLGYSGVIGAAALAGTAVVMLVLGVPEAWSLLVLAYALLFGAASYGVLKRRRWGWLFHIPLSLNPGLWAFNSVYASNRWRELASH